MKRYESTTARKKNIILHESRKIPTRDNKGTQGLNERSPWQHNESGNSRKKPDFLEWNAAKKKKRPPVVCVCKKHNRYHGKEIEGEKREERESIISSFKPHYFSPLFFRAVVKTHYSQVFQMYIWKTDA